MSGLKVNVPEEMLVDWQNLLDILATKFVIPAALIMKVDTPRISVLLSSKSKNNPYTIGESEKVMGSGLYCERVIKTKSKLLVPDALKDIEWNENPDLERGMISYVGFPILYPDGDIFGTICMLDSKANTYEGESSKALELFSEYVESYLDLKTSRFLEHSPSEVFEKEVQCDNLLKQIESLLEIL